MLVNIFTFNALWNVTFWVDEVVFFLKMKQKLMSAKHPANQRTQHLLHARLYV